MITEVDLLFSTTASLVMTGMSWRILNANVLLLMRQHTKLASSVSWTLVNNNE